MGHIIWVIYMDHMVWEKRSKVITIATYKACRSDLRVIYSDDKCYS